jgi:hypothetical protein
MSEIESPFVDKKAPTRSDDELLAKAKNLAASFNIHFTQSEEEALAKVIGAVLRSNSWVLQVPSVKQFIGE